MAILTSEPPTNPGGVEHVVRELVKGLEHRGYDVLVLHRGSAGPQWLQHPKTRFAKTLGDVLISWFLGCKLRQVHTHRLAGVITNGSIGWYLPKFDANSFSRVHIYHGTYRGAAEAMRPFITPKGYFKLKWWDSMLLERASGIGKRVVFNSEQTRDEVRRFFGHCGITTWLPLDTNHFRPLDQSTCRRTLGLQERGLVGLFAGSAHPLKGLMVVQRLIEWLPDVRWILALRGSIPTELRSNPQVDVFQDASYELLPTLYGAADFAVLPSRYESFGYVVAESLACGTPVVTTPGGASRLLLTRPPLDSLLVQSCSDVEQFKVAVSRIVQHIGVFREAVVQVVRPQIQELMAPEAWWPRFLEVAGL